MGERDQKFEEFLTERGLRVYDKRKETFEVDRIPGIIALIQNLGYGYMNRKIIISKSKVKELDGLIIDGFHRLYAMWTMQKKGLKIPDPIMYDTVIVDNEQQLRSYIATWEKFNQSKSAGKVDRHCEQMLRPLINAMPENATLDQWCDTFTKAGFADTTFVAELFNEAHEPPREDDHDDHDDEDKKDETAGETPGQDSLDAMWETDDDTTSSRCVCPDCGTERVHFIRENSIVKTTVLKKPVELTP